MENTVEVGRNMAEEISRQWGHVGLIRRGSEQQGGRKQENGCGRGKGHQRQLLVPVGMLIVGVFFRMDEMLTKKGAPIGFRGRKQVLLIVLP